MRNFTRARSWRGPGQPDSRRGPGWLPGWLPVFRLVRLAGSSGLRAGLRVSRRWRAVGPASRPAQVSGPEPVGVPAEFSRRAGEHDLAPVQDIGAVGELHHLVDVLLDQQ